MSDPLDPGDDESGFYDHTLIPYISSSSSPMVTDKERIERQPVRPPPDQTKLPKSWVEDFPVVKTGQKVRKRRKSRAASNMGAMKLAQKMKLEGRAARAVSSFDLEEDQGDD